MDAVVVIAFDAAGSQGKAGSITVGEWGTNTGPHLFTLLLGKEVGIKLQYIPFTGAAPPRLFRADKQWTWPASQTTWSSILAR